MISSLLVCSRPEDRCGVFQSLFDLPKNPRVFPVTVIGLKATVTVPPPVAAPPSGTPQHMPVEESFSRLF